MKAGHIPQFKELLHQAEHNASDGWQMDFVADMRLKYTNVGDSMYLTEAQLRKLELLAGMTV